MSRLSSSTPGIANPISSIGYSTLVVLVLAFERSFQANAKKVLANAFVVHVTMTLHRLTVG